MVSKEDFVKEAIANDAVLKRKLFTDELDAFMDKFELVSANYSDMYKIVAEHHGFPSRKVPEFVNKLMPVALNNLAQKHEVIVELDKNEGDYWERCIVATPQGMRQRGTSGYHTADLKATAIKSIFIKKANDVEAWMKTHKPKKLQDYLDFRTAFVTGFKDEYCTDDRYGSDKEKKGIVQIDKKIPKKVVSVINENKSYGRRHSGEYGIERIDLEVSEISIRYSIAKAQMLILLIDGDKVNRSEVNNVIDYSSDGTGFAVFQPTDALRMMELRELLPDINLIIDEAKAKIANDNKVMEAWWASFNQKMNKYVSMMNL